MAGNNGHNPYSWPGVLSTGYTRLSPGFWTPNSLGEPPLENLPPNEMLLADHPDGFRSRLLAWFDNEGRTLPWRTHRSLYGTWISEMMLQQTTVAVVEPYWLKFMARFPDVQTLAAATEEEVLSHWSGLGYYRRARHLHAAAKMVLEELDGELPRTRDSWLNLPGVGPYASGAIASIGLGQREPAIDANVRRVLSRWLLADPSSFPKLKPARLERVAADLVDPARPGAWNESLMELGALVCSARSPRCGICPVQEVCRAGRAGTAEKIPPRKTPTRNIEVETALLAVLVADQVLLLAPQSPAVAQVPRNIKPVRGDLKGLHGGLWGLPAGPWLAPTGSGASHFTPSIWGPFLAGFSESQGVAIKEEPVLVGSFRHAITKYRLTVRVYGLRLGEDSCAGAAPERPGPLAGDKWPVKFGSEVSGADPDPLARFCRWPEPRQPVSNLVNKGMALLIASSV